MGQNLPQSYFRLFNQVFVASKSSKLVKINNGPLPHERGVGEGGSGVYRTIVGHRGSVGLTKVFSIKLME